jgi:hypothetical protein
MRSVCRVCQDYSSGIGKKHFSRISIPKYYVTKYMHCAYSDLFMTYVAIKGLNITSCEWKQNIEIKR